MPGFVLTGKAKSDLRSIAIYTQNIWGKTQRNIYISMLDKEFHELAANLQRGINCNSLRGGYLKSYAGKHIIFYRKIDVDLIEIVRILHQNMDIDLHL